MLEHLFITFTKAMEGAVPIALGASFIWGILSVILSPCHLSSIPLIIGFISEQGNLTTKKAFGLSFLFGLGILITIAVIGIVTAAMGRMMGDVGKYGNYIVAAVFFIVGLHLVGIIPMPFSGPGSINIRRKGLAASFILGLVFGVALGPCTFAYMAPVLTLSLKVAATSFFYAALLLAVYGIGHCTVIVAAGTSTEAVQNYLNWNERSKGANIVKRICGVLVMLGGVYLIYAAR
ncbi:cytochrome c biogenesis protein CcdA [bacterium]|nr:cytochrome c biogenesis protein CcdA [bacterium]